MPKYLVEKVRFNPEELKCGFAACIRWIAPDGEVAAKEIGIVKRVSATHVHVETLSGNSYEIDANELAQNGGKYSVSFWNGGAD